MDMACSLRRIVGRPTWPSDHPRAVRKPDPSCRLDPLLVRSGGVLDVGPCSRFGRRGEATACRCGTSRGRSRAGLNNQSERVKSMTQLTFHVCRAS